MNTNTAMNTMKITAIGPVSGCPDATTTRDIEKTEKHSIVATYRIR